MNTETNPTIPMFVTNIKKLAAMLKVGPGEIQEICKGDDIASNLLLELLEEITGIPERVWISPEKKEVLDNEPQLFFLDETDAELEIILKQNFLSKEVMATISRLKNNRNPAYFSAM